MFTPTLDLEVLNKSTILRFSDITGPDTGDGTKWDGVAGILSSSVTSALLTVTNPNGLSTVLDVTSVITGALQVTEELVFPDIVSEWPDGYYNVVYDVHVGAKVFSAVSDYSATVNGTIRITSNNHGLVTGMKVTVIGDAGIYDGVYDAVRIDDHSFYILGTFIDTENGSIIPYYSTVFAPFVFANVEMAITRMFAIFTNMDESVEGDAYLKQTTDLYGLLLTLRSCLTTTTPDRVNNIYGRITRILDFNNIELTYQ